MAKLKMQAKKYKKTLAKQLIFFLSYFWLTKIDKKIGSTDRHYGQTGKHLATLSESPDNCGEWCQVASGKFTATGSYENVKFLK